MKKSILSLMSLLVLMAFVTSCSSDEPSGESIFVTEEEKNMSEFDKWLYAKFTVPYNIEFRYRYQDSETDNYYNVVPAEPYKAQALAILVKSLWIDAYETVFGATFIKQYGPKVYQLLGSPEFDSQQSIVLGYAESGVKITLFRVNEIDLDNIYVNLTDAFRDHYALPMDLNYWYFHTMHHEFFHIMTQTRNFPTDFNLISAGKYHTSDWINVKDDEAPMEGFVTGYASKEPNEDMAEVFYTYVTSTDVVWNQILDKAASESEEARDIILQKLNMVRDYLNDSWGISLDVLREEVLRRTEGVYDLDLRTLKY